MKTQRQTSQGWSLNKVSEMISAGTSAIVVAGILATSSAVIAKTIVYPDITPATIKPIDPGLISPVPNTVYSAKFTCGLWDETKTLAQLNQGIGAGPPLPPEHSTTPGPVVSAYYQDFQPGNYSTALNIFNPNRHDLNLQVVVSSESLSSPQTVATLNIASLNAARVGCSDIEPIIAVGLNKGELVEGFLYISRSRDDIQVQAVYTYSTIAAFQEFRGGFVDDYGVIPGEDIDIFPAYAGAGAGAGGLGLGGSIDVETIEPWTSGE